MKEIKYLQGIEKYGIDYDWKFLREEYKKLNCPPEVYDPTTAPIDKVSYIFNLSIRSVGKTTSWLLWGMLMNKHYGTTICYVRETEEQTAPKFARDLLNVVNGYEHGRYIRQITDGKYNSVIYNAKRIYYTLRDESGKEIDRAPEAFMIMLSIDLASVYKSTLNVFRGDFFIVDEFIGKYYRDQTFEQFMDLLSTVGRRRRTNKIVMLANTIRYTSPWYREFMIQREIKTLQPGSAVMMKTEKGTPIYIEMVEPKAKKEIEEHSMLYFGFDNPALAAITGTDVAWALPVSPRIKIEEDDRIILKNIRIRTEEDLKINLVYNKAVGLHVNVYPATHRVFEDEILLTLDPPESKRELWALGSGELLRKIWDLYKRNMFRYSDNETAALLDDYVRRARDAMRGRI